MKRATIPLVIVELMMMGSARAADERMRSIDFVKSQETYRELLVCVREVSVKSMAERLSPQVFYWRVQSECRGIEVVLDMVALPEMLSSQPNHIVAHLSAIDEAVSRAYSEAGESYRNAYRSAR